MQARSLSVFAAAAVAAIASGCATNPPGSHGVHRQPVDEKIAQGVSGDRAFILRNGVTLQHAADLLGALDGKGYVAELGEDLRLPGTSRPIRDRAGFADYMSAYGYTVEFVDTDGSAYTKLRASKARPASLVSASASGCSVDLTGTIPLGPVISDICRAASLQCNYADTGAAAYAGALYSAAYSGNCAGAIEYLARRADLNVSYGTDSVEFRMMDTATIDLGIPLRDRTVALDILAEGASQSGSTTSSGYSGTSSGSSSTSSSTSSSGASSGKYITSGYSTNYFQSIRAILESSKTPWGTWHYIPETGQIFIRDKAEAVAAVRSSLNRVAQAFQGRFDVTVTLYRFTEGRDREVGSNLSYLVNSKLSLATGASTFLPVHAAGILSYTDSKRSAVINILSEWGTVETLDTYSLNVQAGIPQTLKIANNTEYVRNITTDITGTTGTLSSSIEQAMATDGAFVTVQARQAGTGKIAVDLGLFVNRLDGFDTTQTQTTVVKSQRGFERTFDTMAMVDEGVPYVAAVVSQKSSNDKTSSLPGLEGAPVAGLLGGNARNETSRSYIVMMIEARRN